MKKNILKVISLSLLFTPFMVGCGPNKVTPPTVQPIVEGETITNLEVKTNPTKLTYMEWDYFDPTGLTLTATYSKGTKLDIKSDQINFNSAPLRLNDTEVEVSFDGLKVKIPITVIEKQVLSAYKYEAEDFVFTEPNYLELGTKTRDKLFLASEAGNNASKGSYISNTSEISWCHTTYVTSDMATSAEVYLNVACNQAFNFADLFELFVNGKKVSIFGAFTPAQTNPWVTFKNEQVAGIQLVEGDNVIVLSHKVRANTNQPNFDTITLKTYATLTKKTRSKRLVEAESGTLSGTAHVSDDTYNTGASNGKFIGDLSENQAGSISFKVTASEACKVSIFASFGLNGFTWDTSLVDLSVSNASGTNFFNTSGAFVDKCPQSECPPMWFDWMPTYLGEIELAQGENTIIYSKATTKAGSNTDYFLLYTDKTLS